MEITQDWLDSLPDDDGLTKGQEYLLWKWCVTEPFVGKQIPDQVARFLEKCRGYRPKHKEAALIDGWT